ncbi:MAG: hypothetical protein EOO93_19605 [Pedobacter sp.]|nr:MAG: hypothetical protein EOO93_19605 [Pedobacter sp.]
MKPSLYNLIIGFFALIVLIVPFFGKTYDKRRKWFTKIRPKGWIIISAFIATVIFTYLKDASVEDLEIQKEMIVQKEKKSSDSLSRIQNDESNTKTINTFTKALAVYGLKYDSTEKVIAKLVKDSSKTSTTNNYTDPSLTIQIELVEKIDFNNRFQFTTICNDATATSINLKCYYITEFTEKHMSGIRLGFRVIPKKSELPNGSAFKSDVILNESREVLKYYFFITGTYKSINDKTIFMNRLYSYEVENKRFGMPYEPKHSRILELFNGYENSEKDLFDN